MDNGYLSLGQCLPFSLLGSPGQCRKNQKIWRLTECPEHQDMCFSAVCRCAFSFKFLLSCIPFPSDCSFSYTHYCFTFILSFSLLSTPKVMIAYTTVFILLGIYTCSPHPAFLRQETILCTPGQGTASSTAPTASSLCSELNL